MRFFIFNLSLAVLLSSCLENSASVDQLDSSTTQNNDVTLSINDVAITEKTGETVTASVRVTFSKPLEGDMKFFYSTSNSTAVATQDYDAKYGYVEAQSGDTFVDINAVSVLDDLIFEGVETFHVLIIDNGQFDAGGSDLTSTVSITDNDPAPTISILDATGNEDDNLQFQVQLSAAAEIDFVIDFTTIDLTSASPSVDYNDNPSQIFIPAGSTSKNIEILAIADSLDEEDETFEVQITSPTAGAVIVDNQAIGTIVDINPLPSVQFSAATQPGYEHGADVVVTLQLSQVSGRDVIVPVEVNAGSTYSAPEYVALPATVTIPAGNISSSFSVDLIDDALNEGAESLVIDISASITTATIGAQSSHTITVQESDSLPLNLENLSLKGMGFKINGELYRDQIAVDFLGDLNNDGYNELGATVSNLTSRAASETYIIWGKDATQTDYNLGTEPTTRVTSLTGDNSNVSTSIDAIGDVNGDGIDDAAFDYGNDQTIVLGGSNFNHTTWAAFKGGNNYAQISSSIFGMKARGCDFNGDGYNDVVLGNPYNSSDQGYLKVLFGGTGFGSTNFDITTTLTGTNGYEITGSVNDSQIGAAIACEGDINNDGFDELSYHDYSAKRVFIRGKRTGWANFASAAYATHGFHMLYTGATTQYDPSWATVGMYKGNLDFNFDGISDMFFNYKYQNKNFSLLGKNGAWTDIGNLNAEPTSTRIVWSNPDDNKLRTLVFDFDGDGYRDFIWASELDSGLSNKGAVYIYWGRDYATSDVSLKNDYDEKIIGEILGDKITKIGYEDFNGDGIDDLLIGVTAGDGQQIQSGTAYVIYGKNFRSRIDFMGDDTNNTQTGTGAAEVFFGGKGDDTINGAGGSDVLQGGSGDDTILISDYAFKIIKGGPGTDTVRITNYNLDLSTPGVRKFESVEYFDLKTSGTAETLSLSNVAARKLNKAKKIYVLAGANDTVDLSADTGEWTTSGTQMVNGENYNVYDHAHSIGKVYVSVGATVNAP